MYIVYIVFCISSLISFCHLDKNKFISIAPKKLHSKLSHYDKIQAKVMKKSYDCIKLVRLNCCCLKYPLPTALRQTSDATVCLHTSYLYTKIITLCLNNLNLDTFSNIGYKL